MLKFFTVNSKNKYSDEQTESLFEQLEEGANKYTDIYVTVKEGANLYAKQTAGDYIGYYPIHIAAHNIDCNTEAVKIILRTFTDPEERKNYLYLKGPDKKNVLEILFYQHEDLAISSIVSLLSYLTANEQQEIIKSLSRGARNLLEEYESEISTQDEITDFATLNYWLRNGNSIDMCKQRCNEAQNEYEGYESDEESLGILGTVDNKKFTAKVTYKDIIIEGVVISQPELMLIPSDWRLETAIPNSQGDHVTAYVLLLSSFSHCKGESVKILPTLVYDLAIRILPNAHVFFEKEKIKIDEELAQLRKVRVETVAALKAHTKQTLSRIAAVENTLKKAEIESIARYVENTIDQFIKMINRHEGESFVHSRKKSLTKSFILKELISILEMHPPFQRTQYSQFKSLLLIAIQSEAGKNPNGEGVTDKDLKNIIKSLKDKFTQQQIPTQLLSTTSRLSGEKLLDLLKNYTPYKKYNEGYVIQNIKEQISLLKKADNQNNNRSNMLVNIAFECFKLFDYPKVNDNDQNNIRVLCQVIPRHWIIINAAFNDLEKLPLSEKIFLFDTFLNYILWLQGWITYQVNESTTLNIDLLKKGVLEFAHLDENHNFAMKTNGGRVDKVTKTGISDSPEQNEQFGIFTAADSSSNQKDTTPSSSASSPGGFRPHRH